MFWLDGKKLASSSADQMIRMWDLASQESVDVMRGLWSPKQVATTLERGECNDEARGLSD